jgi:hypothetical protein
MQPTQPVRRNPGQPATASNPVTERQPAQGGAFVETPARRLQAVVRFRTKMKDGQVFPLVVVLQEEGKALPKKKEDFLPDSSKPMLTVYPIIPGAQVSPVNVDVSPMPGAEAKFMVAPVARGKLRDARVELRSGGKVVSSVPLSMTVSRRRLTKFLAFLTIAVPCVLLYVRTHPMVQMKTELPKAAPRDPNIAIPAQQPGARNQPGGMPRMEGGPGGGRPGGGPPNRGGNGQPGTQSLPKPPEGDAPKKDQEAKPADKNDSGAFQLISLVQETTEKKTTAQDAKDEKKADKNQPADAKQPEKKPEAGGRGTESSAKPEEPGAAKPTADGAARQYELKLEGSDALSYWFQRASSRIGYKGGNVEIGDSSDAVVCGLVWLNNDAFKWVEKDKLPTWANEYCLDYALGDRWKPTDAVSSIYERILSAPFLELFALCALFILTLLVRLAQDPKRRTTKGAVFSM